MEEQEQIILPRTGISPVDKLNFASPDKRSIRIPAPDPLGIFEALSGGVFFDPFLSAEKAMSEETPAAAAPAPLLDEPKTLEELKINTYLTHLYAAYREAPCSGCKGLVESAITGAEVYRAMQSEGLTVDQIRTDQSKIDTIREKVKNKLNSI